MRDHVAICFENISRSRAPRAALVAIAATFLACSERARDPIEIFSSSVALDGAKPGIVTRTLQRGVYLVEAREDDIDARVTVTAHGASVSLENSVPRQGSVFKVVSLDAPGELRVELNSADHRTKTGHVLVRVSKWARSPEARPNELELGYTAESAADELGATGKAESWPLAADKMHEALSHFEAAGDQIARGEAAYTLAYIQYGPRDEHAASVRACEVATEAFQKTGDVVGVENANTLRAAAEIELAATMKADTQRAEQKALYAEAERLLVHAAQFYEQHQLPGPAQYAVNMRAVRAVNVGEYAEAGTLFARAVQMAHAIHDVREEARSLANAAAVDIYRGYVARAATEYETLLPLLDRDVQPYQYAGALGNFGVALIALGDFDRALAVHIEALGIYTRLGEDDERAIELAQLGSLYFRMGDDERALDTLQSAIVAQEQLSDTKNLSSTLRIAGNVASELGQRTVALEYLRRSARIDGNPVSVARTRVRIATELRTMGSLEGAEAELAQPLASTNPLVLADAFEERAHIRLARNAFGAAIQDLRTADARYAELGLEYNRIDTNTELSRVLLKTRDVPGATAAADEAIGIVTRIRVKSANPEWRARFLSARYSPYEVRIAAEMASTRPESAWRSFRIAEEVRGRSLADELSVGGGGPDRASDPEEDALRGKLTAHQLRLESRVQRTDIDQVATQLLRREIEETRAQIDALRARHGIGVTGRFALSESLQEVQRRLPADTAVLAFFVGDVDGHAWLLTKSTLRHRSLPERTTIEQAIVAAQAEIHAGTLGAENRKLAALLLGDLLGTARESHLLVLADGPLNSVAFAALPIPDSGGKLVVERYVLGSAPSLAVAMSSPAHARSSNSRVAVISDPVYAPDDRRLRIAMEGAGKNLRGPAQPSPNNLTRLPYSALEASAVSQAFGAADAIQLSGFDATATNVLALPSSKLAVLHFATHAAARSEYPEQSALFLTEYSPDGSLLPSSRLTVTDIARSGLHADVVVLSGCATGDGNALRGEGVLGLTYGFLANGSRSVVASLWPIEDAATARFMNEFYRAYRTNGRATDALRAAQLASRGNTTPNVWSSFVVRANEYP